MLDMYLIIFALVCALIILIAKRMRKKNYVPQSAGGVIKTARLNKELSQGELAKLINVHRSYITYIENDQRVPSSEIICKLAQILGLEERQLQLSFYTYCKKR